MGEVVSQILAGMRRYLDIALTPKFVWALAAFVVIPTLAYFLIFLIPRKISEWRRRQPMAVPSVFARIAIAVAVFVVLIAYAALSADQFWVFLAVVLAAAVLIDVLRMLDHFMSERLAPMFIQELKMWQTHGFLRRCLVTLAIVFTTVASTAFALAVTTKWLPYYINLIMIFFGFLVVIAIWRIWMWEERDRENERCGLPRRLPKYDLRVLGSMVAATLPALFLLFFYQFDHVEIRSSFDIPEETRDVWVDYVLLSMLHAVRAVPLVLELLGFDIPEPPATPANFWGHAAQLGFNLALFLILFLSLRKLLNISQSIRRDRLSSWWSRLQRDDPFRERLSLDTRDRSSESDGHGAASQTDKADEAWYPWKEWRIDEEDESKAGRLKYVRIRRALAECDGIDSERGARAAAALRDRRTAPLLADLVANGFRPYTARRAAFDALVAIWSRRAGRARAARPGRLTRLGSVILKQIFSLRCRLIRSFGLAGDKRKKVYLIARLCLSARRIGESAWHPVTSCFLSLLQSANEKIPETRFALVTALSNHAAHRVAEGEDIEGLLASIPGLERTLTGILNRQDHDPALRVSAAYASAQFEFKGQETVDTLMKVLENDEAPDLRCAAIMWLVNRNCKYAVDKDAVKDAVKKLQGVLCKSKWPGVRELAAAGIGRLKGKESGILLQKILIDIEEPCELREAAARALGQIGDEGDRDILFLLFDKKDQRCEHPHVRAAAAWAWLKIYNGKEPLNTFETFTSALTDATENEDVRAAIAEGLREYANKMDVEKKGPLSKPAVAPLIRALNDENEDVVAWSIRALGWIRDERATKHLVEKLAHAWSNVRGHAAWALGMIAGRIHHPGDGALNLRNSGLSAAVKPLIAALKDSDKDVRDFAAWALGSIKDDRAVKPLIAALKDSDKGVRATAAWALREIRRSVSDAQKRTEIVDALSALRNNDTGVRVSAAWALGSIKDDRAIKPLIAALKDSDKDVRDFAVWALGEIGQSVSDAQKRTEIVDTLLAALLDKETGVRVSAAWALGQIGGEKALATLRGAKDRETDNKVKKIIEEAIARVEGTAKAASSFVAAASNPDNDVYEYWRTAGRASARCRR